VLVMDNGECRADRLQAGWRSACDEGASGMVASHTVLPPVPVFAVVLAENFAVDQICVFKILCKNNYQIYNLVM